MASMMCLQPSRQSSLKDRLRSLSINSTSSNQPLVDTSPSNSTVPSSAPSAELPHPAEIRNPADASGRHPIAAAPRNFADAPARNPIAAAPSPMARPSGDGTLPPAGPAPTQAAPAHTPFPNGGLLSAVPPLGEAPFQNRGLAQHRPAGAAANDLNGAIGQNGAAVPQHQSSPMPGLSLPVANVQHEQSFFMQQAQERESAASQSVDEPLPHAAGIAHRSDAAAATASVPGQAAPPVHPAESDAAPRVVVPALERLPSPGPRSPARSAISEGSRSPSRPSSPVPSVCFYVLASPLSLPQIHLHDSASKAMYPFCVKTHRKERRA